VGCACGWGERAGWVAGRGGHARVSSSIGRVGGRRPCRRVGVGRVVVPRLPPNRSKFSKGSVVNTDNLFRLQCCVSRSAGSARILFLPPGSGSISQLPVLGIRIRRIRMFLGLRDPDPLVRGTDPDPATDPSLFRNNACKIGF
jgi:hypothetical protein